MITGNTVKGLNTMATNLLTNQRPGNGRKHQPLGQSEHQQANPRSTDIRENSQEKSLSTVNKHMQ